MIKDSRNYGVDLLRIVSMLGVVTLHILGHGGLLDNAGSFFEFSALYFLQTLVQPAVDCFILISGYVGYKKGRYYPRLKTSFPCSLSFSFTASASLSFPN